MFVFPVWLVARDALEVKQIAAAPLKTRFCVNSRCFFFVLFFCEMHLVFRTLDFLISFSCTDLKNILLFDLGLRNFPT